MQPIEITRILKINPKINQLKGSSAIFLWGARKTGKTTLLKQQFPEAQVYDLLDTKLKTKLTLDPSLFRQEIMAQKPSVVVVDEIQKVPELLDEIHYLIENMAVTIILSGSSARKLKKTASNLLGGRAQRYELYGLTTAELSDEQMDIMRIVNHGLIPAHFLDDDPKDFLEAYVLDYLNEEIAGEGAVRNLPAFSRFLRTLMLTHGQLLNYSKVAAETGVSSKTIRSYFEILQDTLLGHELMPWNKRKERRLIETSKFYLFDVGIVNYLRGIPVVHPGTDIFGFSFEHFLFEEVRTYIAYNKRRIPLYYFRTSNGVEVDLIVGDMEVAIEFKAISTEKIANDHLKGLRGLNEEFNPRKMILVVLETTHKIIDNKIEVMNWKKFCRDMWANLIF